MAEDTEGLVYCEDCNWKGLEKDCSTNGENSEGYLECPTKGCTGDVIEL